MKKILISDTSLRLTQSNDALTLSFKEKLEVAKRLDELGVDFIEVGPINDNKADEILIKTICACSKNSAIACVCANSEESIEKSYKAISSAKSKRLIVSLPVSSVQMEYSLKKKPAQTLELLGKLTKKATSICSDVEVSLEDATRAESSFLYSAVKSAIENGAKTITLCDISGAMLFDEFSQFILGIYENVPELKNVCLSISVSDAFSLATACTFTGLFAGASMIKVSALKKVNTLSLEKFVSVMDYVGTKKGYICSINKTSITRIVSQIAQFTHTKNEYQAMGNSDDGEEAITDNTTIQSLTKIIESRGYDLSNEDIQKVYEEFLRLSTKKEVSTKELDVIIASVALQVPQTYELVSFSVQSSNLMSATASVVLKKDGNELAGLSFGNGSVDAAFLALENIIGRHFELDGFELGAVTEGKEAMGQALVKLRNDGKLYSGRGVSTDIVGASIRAYVSALNKIVYEENL